MTSGYDVKFDIPLEKELEERVRADVDHNDFPPVGQNRFDVYKQIKSKLNDLYYRDVASGLTADGGGSAFTRHDLGHVNDVVRRAGELLGWHSDGTNPAYKKLKSFEVFVLLVACLIHDVGNVEGREGHEKRARAALRNVAGDVLSHKEISLISKIAQAHGGKTQSGSKDKIGKLPMEDGVESCKVRPQLLAAVLRYADELAENSRRANIREFSDSAFPNKFCRCISVRIDYDSRRVSLDFTVANDDCELFAKDETGEEMFFVDYISKRVKKSELERRYCDRFMRGFATFIETRVHIEFLSQDEEWHNVHFELRENGYPALNGDLNMKSEGLDGSAVAEKYRDFCQEEC